MPDLLARRLRRQIQKVGKARGYEQDERDSRQKQVERDAPGEEEDVILGAVVPDSPGVVTERPAKALNDPALPAALMPRAAVRYSSVVDPLLELPEFW